MGMFPNPLILAVVDGSEIAAEGFRVVKVIRLGDKDVQTGDQVAPAGVDSTPHPGENAIFGDTLGLGESVILGYLQEKQLAEVGEIRIYSSNAQGETISHVYVKKDGIIELGKNPDDFGVLYNKLAAEFNKLKADHNALAQKWDTFCAAYVPGSPSVTGSPASLTSSTVGQCSADITQAKAQKVKIKS